jgi:hypothetical protein
MDILAIFSYITISSWILIIEKAFPLAEWWTDANFSLQRLVLNIMVVQVEFMADKLALENFLGTTDEFVLRRKNMNTSE